MVTRYSMVVVLIGGMFLPTWWCTWFRGSRRSRRQVVGVDLIVLVLVIVSPSNRRC